jgi:hypothetical protein
MGSSFAPQGGRFHWRFRGWRLKGFQPSRAHVNSRIAAAGSDITARARYLVRNSSYAPQPNK